MARKESPSPHPPVRHTVLIGDVTTMWEKMYWDVDVFLDLQRSYPGEDQPLVYSAINACISAWSLEQWAEKAWKRAMRGDGKRSTHEEFSGLVKSKIPVQGLCADIANTAKHATYRDGRWPGGELALKWDVGSEYNPPGLMLLRSHCEKSSLFHSDLFDLPKQWWCFLEELKLVSGNQPTPKWWRNKLGRMFGNPKPPKLLSHR